MTIAQDLPVSHQRAVMCEGTTLTDSDTSETGAPGVPPARLRDERARRAQASAAGPL